MENAIIELEGLTKNYGSLRVVDDLHLEVNRGEVFGLLGPNGAGKTTTILMMLGLTEPSKGKALICGIDATRKPIEVKRKVGYMPDSVGFYDGMTALENLKYIGRLNEIPEDEIEERSRAMMELVGLGNEMDKKTSAYSRGMKQRLGLADVLIKDPEIIILDEPTLGIDPSGVREFLALIRELSRQQGLTVLISSHHLHQIQQICDRVGIFVKGKLLVQGNIEMLSHQLFGEESYVVVIDVRENLSGRNDLIENIQQIGGVKKAEFTGNGIQVSSDKDLTPEVVRFFVMKGLSITGVRKKEYGLDEIYHRYFENSQGNGETHMKPGGLFKRSFFKKNDAGQSDTK